MNKDLQQWLYCLGILPSIIFAIRYMVQWLASEKTGRSVVMPLFWKLSICGNFLLVIHALIQQQVHVCIVQACSGVIAWRNLNLMQPSDRHVSFFSVVLLIIFNFFAVIGFFFLFSFVFAIPLQWFRLPISLQNQVNQYWHFIGLLGLVLFNGRFWIQWLCAERHKQSYLGVEFWWMSVLGSILCLVYFLTIGDFVNTIGPLFGLVPSIRNLILASRTSAC